MDRRTFLKMASLVLAGSGVGPTACQLSAAEESEESYDKESLSMEKPLIGVSAYPGAANIGLMKAAGIGWIRHVIPYPFVEGAGGVLSDNYLAAKSQAEAWHDDGMEILGVTPMLSLIWPQCGEPGSRTSLDRYGAACAWLASDLRGVVAAWQVANEVDWPPFNGPLNLRQACEMVLSGARGLKRADPSLVVGTNSAGMARSYYLLGYLHGRPYGEEDESGPFDYAGDDGYYGTYQPGGPERWDERIAEVHALTDLPVMINEWGFHSEGEPMTAAELALGTHRACELHKLPYSWGGGHTPEVQAEYITAAFGAFSQHRDKLAGLVFYCWQDEERCHYCGSPGCPVTSRQGLLDVEGRPKPGYYAFRDAVRAFLSDAPTGA